MPNKFPAKFKKKSKIRLIFVPFFFVLIFFVFYAKRPFQNAQELYFGR
jgi:hypothetical protein